MATKQTWDFDWSKLNYTTPIDKIKAVGAPDVPQRIFDAQQKYEDSMRTFSADAFMHDQPNRTGQVFVAHRPEDAQVSQVWAMSADPSSTEIERVSYFDLGSGRTIVSVTPIKADDWRGTTRNNGAIILMDTDGKELFQLWRFWEDAASDSPLPELEGELSNKPSTYRIERLTHDDSTKFTSPVISQTHDFMLFTSTEQSPDEYHAYLAPLTNSNTGLHPDATGRLDIPRTRITLSPPDSRAKWHPTSVSLDNKYVSIRDLKSSSWVPAYILDISDRAALPALPTRIYLPGITEAENQTAHTGLSFSKDPSTPHLMYIVSNGFGDFRNAIVYDVDKRTVLHVTTPEPSLRAIRPINWDIKSQLVTTKAVYFAANCDGWDQRFVMPLSGPFTQQVIEIRWEGPGADSAGIGFTTNDKNGKPFELVLELASYCNLGGLAYADIEPALREVKHNEDGRPYILVQLKLFEQAQPIPPAYKTVAPKVVRFKSFDGLEVPFIYYHPCEGKKRVPLNIEIHGGPAAQSTSLRKSRIHWYLMNELECAVIYPNVRGSIGYGKRYMAADDVYLREDSVKDIGSLLEYIAEHLKDEIDVSKIVVSGGSYGGYMTFACLTYYSDKVLCGLATCGIADWVAFLTNTAAHRQDNRRMEYGDETDQDVRAFLERISPVNRADKITVPLWISHGENDTRVPFEQAHFMYDSLIKRGVYSELLAGVREGHGFKQKDVLRYVNASKILFLERFLGLSKATQDN